jgi:aryl sulfotransferase
MSSGIWWLASYPKSGNTWLRAWLCSLVSDRPAEINDLSRLGPFAGSRSHFDATLGIASVVLSRDQEFNLRPRVFEAVATEAKRPLYCKTHDAYQLTPGGEPLFPAAATAGAVYVVRDPRPVAVSMAHYTADPLDQVIAHMDDREAISGGSTKRLSNHLRQYLLRWSEHVESWLGAPFPVHLVRYEDMQAGPLAAFGAIAAFLGLRSDSAAIAAAVEAASFARLQAQERAFGFVEKPRRAAAFFREGRVDGWRDALTAEQAARIVAAHGAMMQRLGYDPMMLPLVREGERIEERACLPGQ